jgi:methionyl-tRNA formyltransferase
MDAGPVAVQASLEIGPRETRGELERRLADLGAALLTETLGKMADGGVRLTEQDESAATYAPRFKPEEAEVHWDRTAVELDRLIRALAPAPGAFFLFGSERVKILAAAPAAPSKSGMPQAAPGSLGRDGAAWTVTCGEGCLGIDTVQPEGKTAMPFSAFAAGRRLKAGDRLA